MSVANERVLASDSEQVLASDSELACDSMLTSGTGHQVINKNVIN